MILGVTLFALAIALSIMLHEAGHLVTAKAFGMKATQYFVGFGPTIFSFRRGETEYGLKAIPAGGFVKIVGMTPLEELGPDDEKRAFYRFPALQRAVVLAAGSVTHFLIALVVLYIAAVGVGLPSDRPVVGEVVPCVVTALEPRECGPADPPSPAVVAGLQTDDAITAVEGRRVATYEELTRALRAEGGGPARLTLERDGRTSEITVDLATATRRDLDDNAKIVEVGALGVSRELTRTYGPLEAVGQTADLTGLLFRATGDAIVALPAKLPRLWDAVTGGDRDPTGPVSVVGVSRAGGQAVEADEVTAGLGLIASLNIFIGVFNLLPLLPLDGGHLAVLAFEKVRSRLSRAFGRRDPGRVDITRLLPVTYVVVLLFGGFSLLAIYADIVNPIANPFQ